MEYVLAWLKQRIERQHRTSKAAGLFAHAEKLLKAHETSRAIEVLRGLLCYFRTSSEEFKALRSILFRLDGAYQRLEPPSTAFKDMQRPKTTILRRKYTGGKQGQCNGAETLSVH